MHIVEIRITLKIIWFKSGLYQHVYYAFLNKTFKFICTCNSFCHISWESEKDTFESKMAAAVLDYVCYCYYY